MQIQNGNESKETLLGMWKILKLPIVVGDPIVISSPPMFLLLLFDLLEIIVYVICSLSKILSHIITNIAISSLFRTIENGNPNLLCF